MRTLILLAAAALTLSAADSANLSGTWRLDPGASDWNKKERPKSVVLTIEHREPALKISGLVVENNERTNDFAFNGAIDAKEYSSEIGKRMYRRVDARTIESVYKSTDGRFTEKSTVRVSRDGKRLTRRIELQRPDGKFEWTEVYNRQ